MDDGLRELLQVDKEVAFHFFVSGLCGEMAEDSPLSKDVVLYTASVLAHHTLTSCVSGDSMPAPKSLTDIFEHFVEDTEMQTDQEILEVAGAQTLLLTGFFLHQMNRRRHNVRWYRSLGSIFFNKAAMRCEPKKGILLRKMSVQFNPLADTCSRLHRRLWEERFLIRLQ
jgi:hypothetical protein